MAAARYPAFAIAGLVGIMGLSACRPYGNSVAFRCDDDTGCVGGTGGGRCEENGFCSFPDSKCSGSGRSYGSESGSLSGVCVGDETPIDGGDDDARLPEAGDSCYGAANGFVRPCFSAPPTGNRVLSAPIDTNPGSADCEANVTNTSDCVIAAATISVGSVVVTGSRPLVLVAAESIDVLGVLDASSRRQPERLGPNSNPAACVSPATPNNHGGGAGGTLGGKGGNGGDARGSAGGLAAEPVAVTALRGGCHGGEGKNAVGGTGGQGGRGGGAVYLIASSISIAGAGAINASGAGGHGGLAGDSGGGGGGSGGFIGLDATTITNSGNVFANGGGGGEGGDNTTAGNSGSDPTSTAAASGGEGNSSGFAGGSGGAVAPAGGGTGAPTEFGAGGGGGGAGIVKTFRGTVSGNVSPAPST